MPNGSGGSVTPKNKTDVLVNQLVAIRASVDAMLAFLLADEAECAHQKKKSLTVMGGAEKWRCLDCGLEYPPLEKEG